jgi:protein-S-isoprenylcysteine O-methyltransferase
MLRIVLKFVVILFPISEIALAILKRADLHAAQNEDRSSMWLIWIAVGIGVTSASVVSQSVPSARLPLSSELVRAFALAFLLFGLTIRWVAIITLGRFFTVDVAIQHNHALVDRGLYRYVRHPSYSGLLLAFFGLGLFYINWLSFLVLMVPIILAVINRIMKEERALLAALGSTYAAYCERTKRLFPGLL